MSKSFKLDGGDLSIGAGRSYEQVDGAFKLAQDLRLWVLERIGTDPATPTFGSRLDGGVIDGQEVPSFIGQIGTDALVAEVRAEVISLLGAYQTQQITKMKSEMLIFDGKTTLGADEILQEISSVEAQQDGTQIIVRVTVQTLAGTTFRLLIPTNQA